MIRQAAHLAGLFPPTPDKVFKAVQLIIQASFDFVAVIGKFVVGG